MANRNREDSVIEAVESSKTDSNGLIRLSTGVVLKSKRVSNMLFADVMRKFERPKAPFWTNPDTGRDEENYDHPGYKEKMEAYNADISVAIVELMILVGTENHSVPKGFNNVNDNWDEDYKLILGEDRIGVSGSRKRYLMWVKYVAAPSQEDINKIMEAVGRLSGVAEEDVAEAVERFRDNS
jgi:hypothetical protein